MRGNLNQPTWSMTLSASATNNRPASSTQNVSTVTLNLKLDADPDRAMTDVLSKIAQVKSILPREANDPIVTKQSGQGFALMYLSFNSATMTASQITDYMTRVIQPALQTIDGVGNAQFVESLNMAKEAGTDFSGVLCGRATWKDGMPIYAQKGLKALEDFLSTEGVKNINAVNAALTGATSWAKKLGVTL